MMYRIVQYILFGLYFIDNMRRALLYPLSYGGLSNLILSDYFIVRKYKKTPAGN